MTVTFAFCMIEGIKEALIEHNALESKLPHAAPHCSCCCCFSILQHLVRIREAELHIDSAARIRNTRHCETLLWVSTRTNTRSG